ncbi:MAG: DUF3310 domain-containing protein [Lacinutrix sp.]|uniref:DUF3310 domain-containing protein n=1 Tax=Lacinutrix sp. TaxID=1937692 RepID=UPI00309BC359
MIKPEYYENKMQYDVIDVIQDYGLNFNRGNIIKYIIRAGRKQNEYQDLEKALEYLEREMYFLKNKL